MLSQFYIVSLRGDTIINRDLRGDVVKGTSEIFFRKVNCWKGDPPPIFNSHGINYIFIKRSSLYFLFTTIHNVSPTCVVELLYRITNVFKDFCGVLNEECIRKNFVFIYELLDEMLDFGYPQATNTEFLKDYVHNEVYPTTNLSTAPTHFGAALTSFSSIRNPKTLPSNASSRPIEFNKNYSLSAPDKSLTSSLSSLTNTASFYKNNQLLTNKYKSEIFVDIVEKLSIIISKNGDIVSSIINGSLQMKSYLHDASTLKLALNSDIIVRSSLDDEVANQGHGRRGYTDQIIIDDCNFHECANTANFEQEKVLTFIAPDGEFTLMNYRITDNNKVPFRILPVFQFLSSQKTDLSVKIYSEFPPQNYSSNVLIHCALPRQTLSVSIELYPRGIAHTAEYDSNNHQIIWKIKKFMGNSEYSIRCHVKVKNNLDPNFSRKEFSPISMQFEIPTYNISNLQVKYLRFLDREKNNNPSRWVRYVTQSSCYICRL